MSTVVDEHYTKQLRDKLREKGEEIKGLANSWKDEDGKFVVSTDEHAKYLKAVSDAKKIKGLLAAQEDAKGIFEFLDAPQGQSSAGVDAGERRQVSTKSLGRAWTESEAFQEAKASAFKRLPEPFTIERGLPDLAFAAAKDIYSAMGGTIEVPTLGMSQNLGWTERVLRPGRVRDLFSVERTNAAMLYSIRETGYINRAAVVPERTSSSGGPATGLETDVYGLKPKSELTITTEKYPVATIAHIMYAHKTALDDEPRLRGLIDRNMIDGVKMAEDDQLLFGNGVGDNLTGIFNTPGIQHYSGLPSDQKSAQIRRAATRAILAYFPATGVVLHPLDFEDLELERDKNGNYTVATSIAVGAEKRVWRMTVVDTPAMMEGLALVGSFGSGAAVYDREAVNVVVSTENRDNFERNAVTIRAEERIALVVDRPESFVALDFTDYDPDA